MPFSRVVLAVAIAAALVTGVGAEPLATVRLTSPLGRTASCGPGTSAVTRIVMGAVQVMPPSLELWKPRPSRRKSV